jgi:hypothetical protein
LPTNHQVGGSTVWAYVMGKMCGLIASFDEGSIEFEHTMDRLAEMEGRCHLPPALRERLHTFFYWRRRVAGWTENQALLKMMCARSSLAMTSRAFSSYSSCTASLTPPLCSFPTHSSDGCLPTRSPALRGDVALHISYGWLKDVAWVAQGSRGFVASIALALSALVFAPAENIPGEELHVVLKGIVIHGMVVLPSGRAWGVDTILSDRRLKRANPARALTFVECAMLRNSALEAILAEFPAEQRRVRRSACWLALRRWVAWVRPLARDNYIVLPRLASCTYAYSATCFPLM